MDELAGVEENVRGRVRALLDVLELEPGIHEKTLRAWLQAYETVLLDIRVQRSRRDDLEEWLLETHREVSKKPFVDWDDRYFVGKKDMIEEVLARVQDAVR